MVNRLVAVYAVPLQSLKGLSGLGRIVCFQLRLDYGMSREVEERFQDAWTLGGWEASSLPTFLAS